MTDFAPLTLLLQENERVRDVALAEHQRAITASTAAAVQVDQLRDYRRDYEQRWSAHFQREGPIELYRCYQTFMERMTKALDQQVHVVERARQQVVRAHAVLTAAELRCASVRKLIERRVREQHLAAERRDQKQSDELATRAAWDRRQAADPSHPH
jgi:flagellar FliJ protein